MQFGLLSISAIAIASMYALGGAQDADTIAAIQRGESVDSIRQKTGKARPSSVDALKTETSSCSSFVSCRRIYM